MEIRFFVFNDANFTVKKIEYAENQQKSPHFQRTFLPLHIRTDLEQETKPETNRTSGLEDRRFVISRV